MPEQGKIYQLWINTETGIYVARAVLSVCVVRENQDPTTGKAEASAEISHRMSDFWQPNQHLTLHSMQSD